MARNAVEENISNEASGEVTEGGKKKRGGPRGPRTPSAKYLLVRILDASGGPVEGGSVQVLTETKDVGKFYDALQANPGSTVMKLGGDQVAKTE